LITAVFLLFGFFATAQETTSNKQGIVTDSTNAVSSATIVAVHIPTILSRWQMRFEIRYLFNYQADNLLRIKGAFIF
jgi:hypothetical protein